MRPFATTAHRAHSKKEFLYPSLSPAWGGAPSNKSPLLRLLFSRSERVAPSILCQKRAPGDRPSKRRVSTARSILRREDQHRTRARASRDREIQEAHQAMAQRGASPLPPPSAPQ